MVIEDSTSLLHEDWLHVSNREKKKKGWIRRANVVSFSQTDVQLALRYYIAQTSKEQELKKTRLEEILSEETFKESQLRDLVQTELQKLKADLPEEKQGQKNKQQSSVAKESSSSEDENDERLFITEDSAPIFSRPVSNTEAEDMIAQLKEGDVCLVLEVGDRMVMGGNNDYWYRVQHEEREGWIHGFYTSRRATD